MKYTSAYADKMATWYSAFGLGMMESIEDCGKLYNLSSRPTSTLPILIDICHSALQDAPSQPSCYCCVPFEPNLYQLPPEGRLTSSF